MGLALFDAVNYDREVLRPLRGSHGQLPPGDLFIRYAIDPNMDAEALSVHLFEIRAWWQSRKEAPDFRAEVCKLLIRLDEELQATVGEVMNDPAWWREQARTPLAASPVTAPEQPTAGPVEGGPLPRPDWRADGRAQFWRALTLFDRRPSARAAAAEAVAPGGRPRRTATTESDSLSIVVEPLVADGDRCQVALSWSGPPSGVVRLRCSPFSPPFSAGDEITWAEAREWGEELTGPVVDRTGRTVLTTVVSTGYQIYLPFQVEGDHARVGRPVGLAISDPVLHLHVVRQGIAAVATWVWPGRATAVQAEWTSGDTTEHRTVTRAQFAADHGLRIEDARRGGRLEIRALAALGDGVAHSPPTAVGIDPAPPEIRYDIRRRRHLRGTDVVLTFTADRDCHDLRVEVLVAPGELVPLDVDRGEVIERLGPLDLLRDVTLEFSMPWPEVSKRERPYWIRCFFRAPQPVSVTDPTRDHMRFP
jgi:hypothetical protein